MDDLRRCWVGIDGLGLVGALRCVALRCFRRCFLLGCGCNSDGAVHVGSVGWDGMGGRYQGVALGSVFDQLIRCVTNECHAMSSQSFPVGLLSLASLVDIPSRLTVLGEAALLEVNRRRVLGQVIMIVTAKHSIPRWNTFC